MLAQLTVLPPQHAGRLHPSVVAETLPAIIRAILDTAAFEDWSAVTRQLTAEASETLRAEHAQ